MPLGYKLTVEQKEQIHRQLWCPEIAFNAIQDVNDVWFLPDFLSDTPLIAASQYGWVVELPIEYFEPKIIDFPFQ